MKHWILAVPALLVSSIPGIASAGTLLADFDYETGTPTSGYDPDEVSVTHASAPDAAFVVDKGQGGGYAITHKVDLASSSYNSDGAPRSESAAERYEPAIFHPGDERRYEFSFQLRNWATWEPGESEKGDIIWQAKRASGGRPAMYVMTKRDALAFRAPTIYSGGNPIQFNLIDDYTPYIEQWIDVRIDVVWSDTDTGLFETFVRLPGESDYVFQGGFEDVTTFNPVADDGSPEPLTRGYIKWGLYRPGQSLAGGDVRTRFIYHDDVRIYDLDPPAAPAIPEPASGAVATLFGAMLLRRRRKAG